MNYMILNFIILGPRTSLLRIFKSLGKKKLMQLYFYQGIVPQLCQNSFPIDQILP